MSPTADIIVLPGAFEVLARTKTLIVRAVETLSADDCGYFGPGSISWQIFSHASYGASGLAAVLVQALHPVAMATVDQRSAFRTDPWRRAHLTAGYVFTITFSSRVAATQAAKRVRQIHRGIGGMDPNTGKLRRADEAELLLWVHAIHADYALRGYEALVRQLSSQDADRFVAEQVKAAELVGLDPKLVPASVTALRAYIRSVPELSAMQPAREFAQMLMQARMPLTLRPFWALHLSAAVGLLPTDIRQAYGMEHWRPSALTQRLIGWAFWVMNYGYLLFRPVRQARKKMRGLNQV